jgi:integrase/recombinase XerD
MRKISLADLTQELDKEMLRLGYTNGSMQFYRKQWQALLQFAQEQGETFFSEELGIEFAEKHFRIFEKDSSRNLSQSDVQKLRVIRMIGDFQLHRFRSVNLAGF